ncbi:MAG: hypothetical protein ABI240_03385 [Sphingomonas sp.]
MSMAFADILFGAMRKAVRVEIGAGGPKAGGIPGVPRNAWSGARRLRDVTSIHWTLPRIRP